MSKHRLPLDSLKWTPLTEVYRFVCEQTGDRRLAAQDLTDAMANDRVRSMRRNLRTYLLGRAGTRTAAGIILGDGVPIRWLDRRVAVQTQGSPPAGAPLVTPSCRRRTLNRFH